MNSTQDRRESKPKKKFQIQLVSPSCKRCGICVEFCPGKVFSAAQDGDVKVVNPDSCTGCLLCELRCPDYALEVIQQENL